MPIAEDALAAASKSTLGLSELARVLLTLPRRIRMPASSLEQPAHRILSELDLLLGDTPWLLVADNPHWWDERSLAFLRLLLLPALRRDYRVVRNSKLLVLHTEGEDGEQVEALREEQETREVRLQLASAGSIPDVLEAFGCEFDQSSIDLLADVTGCHLQLLRDLAVYLSATDSSALEDASQLKPEQAGFLRDSLLKNLRASATEPEALTEALLSLAAIGSQFLEEEAACLLGETGLEARRIIRELVELRVLQISGRAIRFSHDVVQQALYGSPGIDLVELHGRFADCLRLLSPTDHETRAYHLAHADRHQEAGELRVLGSLARLRNGVGVAQMAESADMWDIPWSATLHRATRSWLEADYSTCTARLDELPPDGPDRLQAERVYLLADCWLKSMGQADRLRALDLLSEWAPRMTEEFDVWFRLSATQLVALVQCGETREAQALEKQLGARIEERRKIDRRVDYYRFGLYRRSSMLHDPEICVRRQRDTLAYFRPRGGMSRSLAEYVRAAGSTIGTLVTLGELDEATVLAEELASHAQEASGVLLPSMVPAVNNCHLADHLAGNSHAAAEGLRTLAREAERVDDKILILSNLAAIEAPMGRLEIAEASLLEAEALLNQSFEPDEYHSYFVASNLLCLQSCMGQIADPLTVWDLLGRHLPAMPANVGPMLRSRHELVREALESLRHPSTTELDEYVLRHHPQLGGRVWGFYSRAFLLSDLQDWSDG